MHSFVRTVTIAAIVFLGLASSAAAQLGQTGNLVGKVEDSNGGLLPGVTVEVTSPALIRPMSAVTDASGSYRFIQLPIGTYRLTFTLEGFATLIREEIPVSAERTLSIDIVLQIAGVAETVTVSGGAPVVDVRSATSAVNLDRRMIDTLPTSRDIWSFLQNQAPSVVTSREDVGGSESGLQATFSAHGSSVRQNTFSFNGINVTGVNSTGTTDLYFDYDSFDEIQISTAAHKAEVSTPGVSLNIVARSGTDTWRGAVQDYFTSKTLQSDNLDDELRAKGVARGQGIDQINSFSVQAGGPLIKQKLTIYGNYRDDRTKRFVIGFPLTEDTIIKAPLVNATFQLNNKNKINAVYTYNKYDKPNRNAGPLIPPETTWHEDNHTTVWGVEWQSTLSNQMLLDVRVGYTGNVFRLFLQPGVTTPHTVEQTTRMASGAAARQSLNGHERFQFSGYLSYYKPDWLGGSHDLKVGYDVSRGPNETAITAFDGINLVLANGQPFSVTQYNTPALPRELHWFFPFYAQDTYTRGRTTLSLGLRFEAYTGKVRESTVPAGRFVPARTFPDKRGMSFEKFLPRVAFSHDVFGDSRLAVKASYGRYAHTAGSPWFNAISEAGLGSRVYRWLDANGDKVFQPGEEGALLTTTGGSITSVDPSVRQPFTDELTAGIDSGILKDVRLSATFVYRRERDLLGITNIGVPASAFSLVAAIDPGLDGVAGTSDDQAIQIYNQDRSTLGQDRLLVTNPGGFEATYHGLTLTAQKRMSQRWQALASLAISKQDLTASSVSTTGAEQESSGLSTTGSPFLNPNSLINNTSGPSSFDRTYVFKTSSSYLMPFDILVSGTFKIQGGTPYARIVTLRNDATGTALNQGSVNIFAEPRGSRRYPVLSVLDLRVAKVVQLGGMRRLEIMADVFNVGNANTITSINGQTGPQFDYPQAILGPRVARLGARFSF